MSMLPSLRVIFNKEMSDMDVQASLSLISELPGVCGVHFNAASRTASVNGIGGPVAARQIREIDDRITVDARHRF